MLSHVLTLLPNLRLVQGNHAHPAV